MLKRIVLAGFGGQGVMMLGQLLAYSGMLEGKFVSWIPSYGPEMRGGTANCAVCVSDKQISSPLAAEPDILVAMNTPSLDKFEPMLMPRGVLFINSSLIDRSAGRNDLNVYYIPANETAGELDEPRIANMIMLGALLAVNPIVSINSVMKSLEKVLSEKKRHLLPLNRKALEVGSFLSKSERLGKQCKKFAFLN